MAGDSIFLDDDDDRAKIAKPSPAGTPLTLRGVPPAAPDGSTAGLEQAASKIPSQMGASLRTATQPEAPSPLQQQTTIDRAQQQNLNKGSGISQIANPYARNALRGVNVLGSVAGAIIPQIHSVMGAIPGTEEHHHQLVRQNTQAIANDEGQAKEQATTQEAGSRSEEAQAQAQNQLSEATARDNPKPPAPEKPEDLQHALSDATQDAIMRGVNPADDPHVKQITAVIQGAQKPPADKQDTMEQQYQNAVASGDGITAHRILKVMQDMARAKQAPEREQRPQQQLAVDADGNVIELKPGSHLAPGTKSLSGDLAGNKPTADETRRADMADNLNENLNALEGIVTSHPELFGPLGGRITGLKGMIGSNDPNVGALEAIKHQLGMVQISTHGMRSAQGVAAAADSILNSFHNGPEAVKAAINAARNSAATFQKDAGQAPGATSKGGAGRVAPSGGTVNMKAPDGTVKPVPSDQVEHFKSMGAMVVN